MLKIGIDCRYLGMSGIGRFLEGILEHLDFTKNEYYLIGSEEKIKKYIGVKYIFDNTNPYSPKSILNSKNKRIINSLDEIFIPNFIIPFWVKIKATIVLHDMLLLDMPEVNASKMETIVKKYIMKKSLKKASYVFTVSNFSKERIISHFPFVRDKIDFCYQGVANKFETYKQKLKKENYVIYVGNIKKHKGLKTLLKASNLFKNYKLVIVGNANGFKNGDEEVRNIIEESANVTFSGSVSDEELIGLIAKASFLIQPSFYEGFGIPPLEAMYLGTKPILSDIDVLKEIYHDFPVEYFKCGDVEDLARVVNNSSNVINDMKDKLDAKFSYKNFAKRIEEKF